jgi:hypothetical protein
MYAVYPFFPRLLVHLQGAFGGVMQDVAANVCARPRHNTPTADRM